MAKPLKTLNDKHYLFVSRYIECQNAAKAYREVYGISDIKKSSCRGTQLLNEPIIKEEIARQQEELKKKYDIKKEDIIKQHIDISNSNFLDYYTLESYQDKAINEMGEEIDVIKTRYILKNLDELTLAQQRAIKQIKMTKYGPEIVLYDRNTSLQELSKLLGLYEDTINLDTTIDTSSLSNLSFHDLEKLLKG